MEGSLKTVGVLTSGGDAPGMNACIRAVVRSALNRGCRVMGIRKGYAGLLKGDVMEMNATSVANIIIYSAVSGVFGSRVSGSGSGDVSDIWN